MEKIKNSKKKNDAEMKVIYGIGSIILGIGIYFFFNWIENEGESVRINWIIALLYSFFGKTISALIFGAIGAVLLFIGIKDNKKYTK